LYRTDLDNEAPRAYIVPCKVVQDIRKRLVYQEIAS
jgi:hypothetical protein